MAIDGYPPVYGLSVVEILSSNFETYHDCDHVFCLIKSSSSFEIELSMLGDNDCFQLRVPVDGSDEHMVDETEYVHSLSEDHFDLGLTSLVLEYGLDYFGCD